MQQQLRFQVCFIGCLFLLSHLITVAEQTEQGNTGGQTMDNSTTSQNMTKGNTEEDKSTANTGAVVAAVVIAVIACIAVVIIVYIVKRKRQSRMLDKEKKMQIQMSSARNAGVYQDLTVSVPADEKPPASPEHEHLKTAEEA